MWCPIDDGSRELRPARSRNLVATSQARPGKASSTRGALDIERKIAIHHNYVYSRSPHANLGIRNRPGKKHPPTWTQTDARSLRSSLD